MESVQAGGVQCHRAHRAQLRCQEQTWEMEKTCESRIRRRGVREGNRGSLQSNAREGRLLHVKGRGMAEKSGDPFTVRGCHGYAACGLAGFPERSASHCSLLECPEALIADYDKDSFEFASVHAGIQLEQEGLGDLSYST